MKTCNGGYCSYKLIGGNMPECSYQGYCDYRCPKDSRPLSSGLSVEPENSYCSCGTSAVCPIHGGNR